MLGTLLGFEEVSIFAMFAWLAISGPGPVSLDHVVLKATGRAPAEHDAQLGTPPPPRRPPSFRGASMDARMRSSSCTSPQMRRLAFSGMEDPGMAYALAGLASLVAVLLAWRAYRQAADEHRRRKDEATRRRDR